MSISRKTTTVLVREVLSAICLSAILSVWSTHAQSGQPAAQQESPAPAPTPVSKCTEPDQKKCIRVYVSVMDPKVVSDVFGKRIAQRFVAIQVTIANKNKGFQYLIHDVSLNLKDVFVTPLPSKLSPADRTMCEREELEVKEGRRKANQISSKCQDEYQFWLSSLELSLLRGVAEKGQGQDPRNKVLRLFQAVGTIAAGFIGVASFGPSYPKAVAIFNGPVISAYNQAFPDYTINQMNRLSDSAYKSNTLVPKEQAKVLVAFIPQAIFLNKKQRQLFWDEPTALYPDSSNLCPQASSNNLNLQVNCVDFRRARATVDGSFIAEVENLPPAVTTVHFDADELMNFQNDKPVAKGYIIGRFLSGTDISLLNSEPPGLSITKIGDPSENRLNFIIKSDRPVAPGTTLNFEISNDQGVQTISKQLLYMPDLPTLSGIDPAEGEQGASELEVTLTGTNFIAGKTQVIPKPRSGIHVVSVDVKSGTSLKAILTIDANAAKGKTELRVTNPAGQSQEAVTFTIVEPPDNKQ